MYDVFLLFPLPPRGLLKRIPTLPADVSLWRNLIYSWGQVPGPTGSPGASRDQEREPKNEASEGKQATFEPFLFGGTSSSQSGKSETSGLMPEQAGGPNCWLLMCEVCSPFLRERLCRAVFSFANQGKS